MLESIPVVFVYMLPCDELLTCNLTFAQTTIHTYIHNYGWRANADTRRTDWSLTFDLGLKVVSKTLLMKLIDGKSPTQ